MMIGKWVQRARTDGKPEFGRPWHKVESEIEDRVVTNCGRQMLKKLGHKLNGPGPMYHLKVYEGIPSAGDQCGQCWGSGK